MEEIDKQKSTIRKEKSQIFMELLSLHQKGKVNLKQKNAENFGEIIVEIRTEGWCCFGF